jgi:hypothetical protein
VLLVLAVRMWLGPGIWESIIFAFFTFDCFLTVSISFFVSYCQHAKLNIS